MPNIPKQSIHAIYFKIANKWKLATRKHHMTQNVYTFNFDLYNKYFDPKLLKKLDKFLITDHSKREG